jgi:hypothetical protein
MSILAQGADVRRVEARILEGASAFRAEQRLGKLTAEPRLTAAAQEFAVFMARTGKYGHEADGRTPVQRAASRGYDHCLVAENIAYQYSNRDTGTEELARIFMEGWRASPGHRKNLLDADATQTGAAVARAQDGRYYAVHLFGRPASEKTTFEIRNESRATVAYRLGDKGYTLSPRSVRTHGSCRVEKLAIEVPGADPAYRPRNGERFVIEGGAGRLSVRRG